MNNARRYGAGVGLAVVAVVGLPGAILAVGVDSTPRLALTLSGLPASPYGERALRVGKSGLAVRFRAPASTDLANVALRWRRSGAGCTVSLHPDADGAPGDALAAASVPAGVGWQTVPLAAHLAIGDTYHVVARCPKTPRARLGVVLDAERQAVTGGVWQVEDIGKRTRIRRAPVSPLFVLGFVDGTSWGQPYRPGRPRHGYPFGGKLRAAAIVAAGKPLTIAGIEVRLRDPGVSDGVSYEIAETGGGPLIGGTLGSPHSRAQFRPLALGEPVTLDAGSTYELHLSAPGATRSGIRVRPLVSDLAVGPPISGLQPLAIRTSRDGGKHWHTAAADTLDVSLLLIQPAGVAACGNGVVEAGEGCDGPSDAACPGRCTPACACAALPPDGEAGLPLPPPPTPDDGGGPYRSIYAAGFAGAYDHEGPTDTEWPRKLAVIEVDATNDGPRIAGYKRASAAAGNTAASYWFYASLTSIDSKCGCRDEEMYDAFTGHEDYFLHDASGHRISTFVSQIGTGRQIATDVGNPAFADAWADYQLRTMEQEGWDGVWADNIICALDVGVNWSANPVNPRTGASYNLSDYRNDVATALGRIHDRLARAGKKILGNHGGSCVADFASDDAPRRQLMNMDGSAIENCVYDFWDAGCGCNRPLPESVYIDQLRYLSFANHAGKQTECIVQHGGVDTDHRSYGLASYLLTKERYSVIGELNHVSEYWNGPPGGSRGLDTELGAPTGDFYCIDPGNGFAHRANGSSGCPGSGMLYGRDFTAGRVLTNPTSDDYSIDLGGTYSCDGVSTTRVSLAPKSGAVCTR